MKTRARLLLLTTLAASLLFAGCGSRDSTPTSALPPTPAASDPAVARTPAPSGDVTVFAAASLTDAFGEAAVEFQRLHPSARVVLSFGASTTLRTQIEQGARADVFASADQAQMDQAKRAGVIREPDQLFAKNKLVVIHPTANPGRVTTLQDLARPGLKLVLTDRNVPIGAYARTALEQMSADPQFAPDFAQRVLANVRSEEANVRAVVTKVQLGEADAAIVYASDVTAAVTREVQSILIPDQFNVIGRYPIAVVRDARNPLAARAFVDFVRSPAGQAILKKHNLIMDDETGTR